jgi:hypothetical protein
MADGYVDKVKFTGSRISSGNTTDWVRVAPYRLPTDVKAVGDAIFLETKLAGDDSIWEHAWYKIRAGNQLELYRVVDTYLRSGEYSGSAPGAVTAFDGPVEVGGIANSKTLPVIGPDGVFLNGKSVNDSLIAVDVAALQARNDLQNGQAFFALDNRHTPPGGGSLTGGGAGLFLKYDSSSGAPADGFGVWQLTSGLAGRLLAQPLSNKKIIRDVSIAAGGVSEVINANLATGLWKVTARSEADALSFVTFYINGHASAPEAVGIIAFGDLDVAQSGTSIRLRNKGLLTAEFTVTIDREA